MEYLARLGLVPKKSKKGRVTALPHVVNSKVDPRRSSTAEESAGGCKPRPSIDGVLCVLEAVPKCAIQETSNLVTGSDQTAHTLAGFVEIRGTSLTGLPRPAAPDNFSMTSTSDMADSFFPRTSTSGQEAFIDVEFMEYEQHVQARAQALGGNEYFGAPGGRHAWKTLIFWKRRRKLAPTIGRPPVTASSTPLHLPTFLTPGACTLSRKPRHGSRSASNPATVPLYMSDEFSTSSIRPWWEPMVRGGKLSMAAGQDAEFCNLSPYVPLGGRPHPQRIPAAPLYLV